MAFYEIVVHGKGSHDPVVSPTTYATPEEAAEALKPFEDAITTKCVVAVSWYVGEAANINRAFVAETDTRRPASTRSIGELLEDIRPRG